MSTDNANQSSAAATTSGSSKSAAPQQGARTNTGARPSNGGTKTASAAPQSSATPAVRTQPDASSVPAQPSLNSVQAREAAKQQFMRMQSPAKQAAAAALEAHRKAQGQAATATQEQVEEADNGAETGKPDPTDTRFERARRALLRDGLKESDLKAISRRALIARGLAAAERQANSDRDRAELDRLRKATGQTAATKEGQGSLPRAATEPQNGVPTVAALFGELTNSIKEEDPEIAQRLQAALEAKLGPILSELAQRREEPADDGAGATAVEAAFAKVAESFPALAGNDKLRAELLDEAEAVSALPGWQYPGATPEEALTEVFSRLLRGRRIDELGVGEHNDEQRGSAQHGQMDVSSVSTPQRTSPKNAREEAKQLFISLGGQDRERVLAGGAR